MESGFGWWDGAVPTEEQINFVCGTFQGNPSLLINDSY